MKEFLEQQLLIRVRAFATFSSIEKGLACRMKSFRGPHVVQAYCTKLCRPNMDGNSCTKVTTIHMKAKWFQRRMPSWHRDKYTG